MTLKFQFLLQPYLNEGPFRRHREVRGRSTGESSGSICSNKYERLSVLWEWTLVLPPSLLLPLPYSNWRKLVYKPNISKSVSPDILGLKNPLAFQMVCTCHCIIIFVWIAFKILFLPFVYVRAINSSMKNYRSPYNSHSWE